jgi:Uma2 family endonuclease
MSGHYEETVEGESLLRHPPGARHEEICRRLHQHMAGSLVRVTTARLLTSRSVVQLSPGTIVRPDLTLVAKATGKVLLLAEIISSDDHRTDTVVKKQIYEDLNLPRLWMIDSRYDNVEIYHGSQYGMALKHILAGREMLTETLLPEFQLTVAELFGVPSSIRRDE